MKIWLGPAGIPSSCLGSSIDGVREVRNLGLNSMEVEFVRGIHMSNETAKRLGKVARDMNVRLSIHAPYYINLASYDKEKLKASKERILKTLERADHMSAEIIAVHAGYYGKDKERANKLILKNCREISNKIKKKKWKVKLGLETSGKQGQWGSLEEIVEICKRIKSCRPVLDIAHIYARNAGQIDYKNVFNLLKPLRLRSLHFHFSGIKYSVVKAGKGNERYHLTLKTGGPSFRTFAKELLKRKINATIISESPIQERDSLYMKRIFEDLGHKII